MKNLYSRLLVAVVLLCYLLPTHLSAQFTDVSAIAGINILHDGDETAEGPPMGSIIGSGAAWIDYDNDGWLDLYVTMRQASNLMYHNNGDGTFTEMAGLLGLADADNDGAGVVVADYDNDGWTDIYLANGTGDRLFRNINGTVFQDVTASAGINPNDMNRGTSASWGDYDMDGYLDLYVAHHHPIGFGAANLRDDRLYHNNGDGTFTEVSNLLDDYARSGASFIAAWVDIDNDCDLDIIQINDCPVGGVFVPVRIYRNNGGDHPHAWQFEEVSNDIGVDACDNGMGIGIGDIDHNGYMDFYYSDIGPTNLYKNFGGQFTDVSASPVNDQTVDNWSWGTAIFDYDNDGWLDLMLAMGSPEERSGEASRNVLFRNLGNGSDFEDVSTAMNMDDNTVNRHCIYGDYDNDGDLDVFFGAYGDNCMLKRNDSNNGNNWLKIVLGGSTSNRQGIGARIKISTPDGDHQYAEVRSGSNLGGGDQVITHFGLGTNSIVNEIEVSWPNGTCTKQYLYNVGVNQTLAIAEDNIGGVSCFDGIQNGDETGVDCGGSFCPPCQSCFDGIQNGNETGVDCGGRDCPACPTCDDGIQNGDEDGVDCGGANCDPCITCDDGILNGDEEDVDCGGPDCPPCATCNDNSISLELKLDGNGHQTTWELLDDTGSVLEAGGPYGGYLSGTVFNFSWCLPDACYTFNIYDSGNNGLCCRAGKGSYTITNEDTGSIIAVGSAFASSKTEEFCLGSGSNLIGNVTTVETDQSGFNQDFTASSLNIYPNPVAESGSIWINYQGSSEVFQLNVYNLTGQLMSSTNRMEVQDLDRRQSLQTLGIEQGGVYFLQFTNENEQFVQKILVQ